MCAQAVQVHLFCVVLVKTPAVSGGVSVMSSACNLMTAALTTGQPAHKVSEGEHKR